MGMESVITREAAVTMRTRTETGSAITMEKTSACTAMRTGMESATAAGENTSAEKAAAAAITADMRPVPVVKALTAIMLPIITGEECENETV